MKVRFTTSVADAAMGSFIEGRVINIDPASNPTFVNWLNAGVIEAVRDGDPGIAGPRTAPERAVAQPAPTSGRGPRGSGGGRTKRASASAVAPA